MSGDRKGRAASWAQGGFEPQYSGELLLPLGKWKKGQAGFRERQNARPRELFRGGYWIARNVDNTVVSLQEKIADGDARRFRVGTIQFPYECVARMCSMRDTVATWTVCACKNWRMAGSCLMFRKAETQTLESNRAPGRTSFGSDLRAGCSDVGFDRARRGTTGACMGSFQQGVKVFTPLIFWINGYQADLPFTQPHSLQRFQDTFFVNNANHLTHDNSLLSRQHTLFHSCNPQIRVDQEGEVWQGFA